MKRHARCLLLALLLPAAALAKDKTYKGYEGADPATDQLVHLKVTQESDRRFLFSRRGLSITSIDDKPIGNWWKNAIVVDELLLKPGKHRIGYLATTLNNAFARLDLWFVAEPGKTYASRADFEWLSVRIWIEDAQTGERVGGVVGSVDEPTDAAPAAETGTTTGTAPAPSN
ncbi:hypothetical protein [Lysobacter terrae]